jgi:outer membrane protein insertion porin family
VPGSDLQYYKLSFDVRNYFRITRNGDWVGLLRSSLAYGNGYGEYEGEDQILPFFENYYAGGYRTVRGFSSSTIGPRAVYTGSDESNDDTDSVGGNAKYTLSAELIFPAPFFDEAYSRQIRTSIFVDAGEVWDTEFDYSGFMSECESNSGDCDITDYSKPGNIRVSTGVQLSWMSPMGALVFSLAVPLKEEEDDSTEVFQFNIGNVF